MIEEINSIKNQNTFKKSLFRGTIFKFSNSKNALKIVDTIKKKVQNYYSNNLESLHLEKDAELISKELISKLKNQDQLLNFFEDFLKEIHFEIKDCYRDKFVVRIAPAEFKKATYEASRIGIHRDTWGTNIFEQVNWWAPINNLDQTNTLIFYPEYFNQPIKNTTSTWDLDTYFKKRKLGEFDYPSAPQLLEDLKKETKTIRVNINPGEILCFSGSHLHSSSKENSNTSRFSYEIRTVSDSDIRGKRYAPNVDCALNAKYPKIFKHMVTKNILEIN